MVSRSWPSTALAHVAWSGVATVAMLCAFIAIYVLLSRRTREPVRSRGWLVAIVALAGTALVVGVFIGGSV